MVTDKVWDLFQFRDTSTGLILWSNYIYSTYRWYLKNTVTSAVYKSYSFWAPYNTFCCVTLCCMWADRAHWKFSTYHNVLTICKGTLCYTPVNPGHTALCKSGVSYGCPKTYIPARSIYVRWLLNQRTPSPEYYILIMYQKCIHEVGHQDLAIIFGMCLVSPIG